VSGEVRGAFKRFQTLGKFKLPCSMPCDSPALPLFPPPPFHWWAVFWCYWASGKASPEKAVGDGACKGAGPMVWLGLLARPWAFPALMAMGRFVGLAGFAWPSGVAWLGSQPVVFGRGLWAYWCCKVEVIHFS